jgi:hypothetical protein
MTNALQYQWCYLTRHQHKMWCSYGHYRYKVTGSRLLCFCSNFILFCYFPSQINVPCQLTTVMLQATFFLHLLIQHEDGCNSWIKVVTCSELNGIYLRLNRCSDVRDFGEFYDPDAPMVRNAALCSTQGSIVVNGAGSAAAWFLGLWFQVQPGSWISLCHDCLCVVSTTGLWVELITRPGGSYRVWCVWVLLWSSDKEEGMAYWVGGGLLGKQI